MKNILAFILGAVLTLAFFPAGAWWLAPFLLFGLLWLWMNGSVKTAFYRGWWFGIGFFGVGVSWIFISIHRFGGASILLAAFLTALFVVALGLFFAIFGALFGCVVRWTKARNASLPLYVFPVFWVLFEWLRSWVLTGFPWLLVGYSQTESPLRGYAPIMGCLGISFLVALSASLLYGLFCRKSSRWWVPLFVLAIIWFGGDILTHKRWTQAVGKSVTVSLIQGNVPQTVKWDPSQLMPTLTKYQLLTQSHFSSDLIIWPEAAVPIFRSQAEDYLLYLTELADDNQTAIILGIPIVKQDKIYNAAIAIGDGSGTYLKRRLVPFGEFVPFEKELRGFIRFFDLPMSDFSPGDLQQPLLKAHGLNIAPLICYEVAYSSLLRRDLPKADLFVVMSNDAWFGRSAAEWQHLQIAQMRALETGRFVLMVTNDGITAIIEPNGHIQHGLKPFVVGVLTGEVFAMKGSTPFMAF